MEFGPVRRIVSVPRFQHSRLGEALRNDEIHTFRKAPAKPPRLTAEEQQFLDDIAADGVVLGIGTDGAILDFRDSTEAARIAEESDPDAELLDLEAEHETASVVATATSEATHETTLPSTLFMEPGIFSTEDVLELDAEDESEKPTKPDQVEEPEDIVIEVEQPTTPEIDDRAFANGAQTLFDDIAVQNLQRELDEIGTKPIEAVMGEPIMEVDIERPSRRVLKGIKSWFKDRLGTEAPRRRRNIAIAAAGMAVATVAVAVIGIGTLRSDNESVSTTAAPTEAPAQPTPATTQAVESSTTPTTLEASNPVPGSVSMSGGNQVGTTTTSTTPEAQVSAPGVPGGIPLTPEQYAAMGTVQFASLSATMNTVWENPNLSEEDRDNIVNFSWALEQNQFAK